MMTATMKSLQPRSMPWINNKVTAFPFAKKIASCQSFLARVQRACAPLQRATVVSMHHPHPVKSTGKMSNADRMKVSMSCTTTAYRILQLDNGSIELRQNALAHKCNSDKFRV
jgi:hypothetical protein